MTIFEKSVEVVFYYFELRKYYRFIKNNRIDSDSLKYFII